LLADFPEIVELDINPLRVLTNGDVLALDARMCVEKDSAAGTRLSE
jgi:succinyl-CoA synthetase beta subunit